MTSDLYYNYPSTAKIRIRWENVETNGRGLLRFTTKRLQFTVAEKLCIRSGEYFFIPLSIYRQELENFYKTNLV